ncbi:putative E3 ubiquitin-protein ligase ARIH2 isoform X1 [Apostichopus japonicus]|uniref:RBR-type E3 ubiquitin transferase n=1 Tax=Stichopus japonicus TaxID=307972 RepID=A0A2G8KHM6_STIJA|nr:putative E3 ubiquitin-protein ligase ARIH2 isoform X1 [Apostichopus japonicus]
MAESLEEDYTYSGDDDDDDDDADPNDYYGDECMEEDQEPVDEREPDPEYFEYKCLTVSEAKTFLQRQVEELCSKLKVDKRSALVLLMSHGWLIAELENRTEQDISNLLIEKGVLARHVPQAKRSVCGTSCSVCLQRKPRDEMKALLCSHFFCKDCWCKQFEVLINNGIASDLQCMAIDCHIGAPEDFVLSFLHVETIRKKYDKFIFRDYIKSHYNLRFCPGTDCTMVAQADKPQSKRVDCSKCKTSFCFNCCGAYHAPTDCETVKKWLMKCADDSETANYISANTKDCPKCHACIEKNGGCNHMQCSRCKHDFCWVCMGDWKFHGTEYYECSRYKEKPDIVNECAQVKAREALKKYLFYHGRWENHARSLELEAVTLGNINKRIQEKVMKNEGTWIDWQYLLDAAALLAKCRYSLQYTYPYAYYLESGPRKKLFEYQQAQLEAEIENLSWKIERAEKYQRGDLQNQMNVAEKRRQTLFKDFFPT